MKKAMFFGSMVVSVFVAVAVSMAVADNCPTGGCPVGGKQGAAAKGAACDVKKAGNCGQTGAASEVKATGCPKEGAACADAKPGKCGKNACGECKEGKVCAKCPKAAEAAGAGVGTLTVEALDSLLAAKVPAVVLDARSGKYDDGERLPGAKSLTDKATAEEAAKLIPSKEHLVVTYCANPKCPASDRLAKHLTKLGYKNVIELPAGIQGWKEAGKPVEKAK